MAPRRLNVLVFAGTGTTSESVHHCMYSLRRLLSSNYAVTPVGDAALLREPWSATCALLVFPGGADLGYCSVFNGAGNSRIYEYVRHGGAFLGLCAGGYYGSTRCEFEVGNPPLDVVGFRELAFFPGACRGAAFSGFRYGSERGARAARLEVNTALLDAPDMFLSYYNGGGVFVDAATASVYVDVLASYADELDVDGGNGSAAVVLCRVGDGKVVLCGPHPEFAAENLRPQPDIPWYADLISQLAADNEARVSFLRACLAKLGLDVAQQQTSVPPLSHLHLSSNDGAKVTDILCAWDDILDKAEGCEVIRGDADTFFVRSHQDSFNLDSLRPSSREAPIADDGQVDFTVIPKSIMAYERGLPSLESTPRFDHELFYNSLARFQMVEPDATDWGSILLYGEVVTSTNSLLEKNSKMTSRLPTGFTFSASTQLAGRGRGRNAWIAPPGALMFSVIINHPAHLAVSRPFIFLQYIAVIAVVEAVQSLGAGYQDLPVKLKWPNDIYALDPTPASSRQYVKIGGVLSHCGYCDGQYQVILGIGINATNPRPTTALTDLLPAGAAPLRIEVLLARILTRLEAVHAQFMRHGFSEDMERRYYRHWLHTGQAISLEAEGGIRARVLGITRDWGMLRAEETDADGRGTGKIWTLRSDENSFDFWKGLIRRKL
ncbi:biotin apo-protein ligase [Ophiocordyceps camponoti-floridani]|uniref:Biotin apo-protein ligase n=1 Tax=Ophiocordyceps camponoti-floridani TaxID=2030778 RepID=A0A8H4VGW3_9HYPO|nr:biotin apo-protein ligase [Ophiocordyceps camponoti-floridani]